MKGKCRLNSIHNLWILLMSIFFITSSVSAAIDFDSPCYTSENPYYIAGYGGQCTAFAWGRTCEKTGIKLQFKTQIQTSTYPHAKYWYEEGPIDSLNLQLGSDIQPNSIAIWEGDTANPYGHVAYIERVEGGIVYFNEANVETYDGSTWGGGYDGYEKSSTIYNFEHRGTGIGNILVS
jgi:surface antigen